MVDTICNSLIVFAALNLVVKNLPDMQMTEKVWTELNT